MSSSGNKNSIRLLVTLAVVQTGLICFLLNRRPSGSVPPPTASLPATIISTNESEPFYAGHAGVWGELLFAHINIEPPDDFVQVDDRNFEPTRWFFNGRPRAEVEKLFAQCRLSPAQRAELADPKIWADGTNGVVITPSPQLILDLEAASRTQIYLTLAEDARNDFHFWPFTYASGGFDSWFAESGLTPATLALVKRLTYIRSESLCFSDLPEMFTQIPTIEERRHLLKTLSRNSTLLIKLRVKPDTDVSTLVDFWGRHRRTKDLKPLLESLTRIPGGITIDASHLLPPFARKRLYTYPPPTAKPPPDCYWSAFNFYNDTPDDRFFKAAEWQAELAENYTPVTTPTFGDIVLLLRPDNLPIHAANYIADDIVFTKNGGSERQPWLFMKWGDLLARYPANFQIRAAFFHPKLQLGRAQRAPQG